jgi:hypothetical protein
MLVGSPDHAQQAPEYLSHVRSTPCVLDWGGDLRGAEIDANI